MLKIALPNKGSLAEPSSRLFEDAGYKCRRSNKELFVNDNKNKVEFYFLRPKDIGTYVESKVFDFGITGKDILTDNPKDVSSIIELNFGRSSLYYIMDKNEEFSDYKQFENKTIATSYPNIIKMDLEKRGIIAKIIKLDGAVEGAIRLGIADIIADVTETKTTIKQSNLKTIGEPIFNSEALLISAKKEKKLETENFIKRISAIVCARRYLMLECNVPEAKLKDACSITQGLNSPTITPLREKGWQALKVIVEKSQIHKVVEELNSSGAQSILISKIEACYI